MQPQLYLESGAAQSPPAAGADRRTLDMSSSTIPHSRQPLWKARNGGIWMMANRACLPEYRDSKGIIKPPQPRTGTPGWGTRAKSSCASSGGDVRLAATGGTDICQPQGWQSWKQSPQIWSGSITARTFSIRTVPTWIAPRTQRRPKPVLGRKLDSEDEWVRYSSGCDAARRLQLNHGRISAVCHGIVRHTGGYVFRFDEPTEPDVLPGEVWKDVVF